MRSGYTPKPNECSQEGLMFVEAESVNRGRRPLRRIGLIGSVDGIEVPYVLDEREYRRRLIKRDAKRRAAAQQVERMRAARAKVPAP